MVGLLPEKLQQLKYEGVHILNDVIRIAEKKKFYFRINTNDITENYDIS